MPFTIVTLILLPIVGFLLGLLVSLWGSGGGGMYIPLLILGFGVELQVAVATSLVTILPVTFIGSASHRREGNLNVKAGVVFGVGGLAGGLFGAYLSSSIPSVDLEKILGFFLIAVGILMVYAGRGRMGKTAQAEPTKATPKLSKRGSFVGIIFGVASGLMTGLVGSSGTPPTMAGLYLLGYPVTTGVGTSVFVTIFSAIAGLIGHVWFGQFDLTLTLLLCAGASTGAFVGPRFLSRVKGRTLEKICGPAFVIAMIALGIALLL
jgi:uncharacterized membrane protein YfcA